MGNAYARRRRRLPNYSFMHEDNDVENAELVYESDDLGELKEGVCFIVSGQITLTCERFLIDLLVENDYNDVALHLSVRLPHNYILRNSRIKNRWKVGESASSQPFTLHRGDKFSIQILITNSAFLISINGRHFTSYLHRIPFNTITKLTVKGEVTDVSIQHLVVDKYPELLTHINSVDLIISSMTSNKLTVNQMLEADTAIRGGANKWRRSLAIKVLRWNDEISTPYLAVLPRNMLKPGRYLKIEGRVKLLPTAFYINLQRDVYFWPHPVVALHLGPRFSSKSDNISKAKIVRCAWYDGSWSPEESSDIDTEFLPGRAFRMAIVCLEDAYNVYLNGKFLLEFKYHVRPEVVDTVYIRGDVKLRWVSLHSSTDREENIFRQLFQRRSSIRLQERMSSENRRRKSFINYEIL